MACERLRLLEADLLQVAPGSFEAIDIARKRVAVLGLVEAEHRSVDAGTPASMLVDEELVVGTIDRVVQHRLMQLDLNVRRSR